MTCDLIEQNYKKLQLSTQRGQGLKLYNLTPGKVVAFLGGTGIVPFGDLIDLLFKAVLIQTNP
jgi:acetylornithine/succinyldiaminopimelate/putrescine aminotransferase